VGFKLAVEPPNYSQADDMPSYVGRLILSSSTHVRN